jgi:hypothetical protein
VYAPRTEYEPPQPDWKRMAVFNDALPQSGPAAYNEEGNSV